MKKRENRNFYTLGELIYLARIRKGLSREEVAKLFEDEKIDVQDVSLKGRISHEKITEKTIKKWENDLKYPDIDLIYVLARFLDADPNKMLASKQYVQKHKVDGIAMKIVGLICFTLDISSNYVGYYYKVVSNVIQIIIVLLFANLMYLFIGA